MKLTIKVTGQKNVIKHLDRFKKEAIKSSESLIKIKSQEITAEAKREAPVDVGNLRANIENQPITPLKYVIVAQAPYSAYMEFGTGKRVSVPSEFADMAAEFKGKKTGSFSDGLKRIKDWCRSHGIDENAAYPIFMSILERGLEPQPFMYPAFIFGRKTFKKDLEAQLQILIKKFNNG